LLGRLGPSLFNFFYCVIPMEIYSDRINVTNKQVHIKNSGKVGGMIVFKAEYCHWCKENQIPYVQTARMLKGSFPMYYIESTRPSNSKLFDDLNKKGIVTSFPTVYFFDSTGKLTKKFSGERTTKGYLNAICKEFKICLK
jgi:thioredoxin-related protein